MSISEQIHQMMLQINSKSFARWLSFRPVLKNWVQDQQVILGTRGINETLFCIQNQVTPTLCPCGKIALFNTFTKGYRKFCNFRCPCKGLAHAQTVADMWSDSDRLAQMISTRDATNLERYGTTNPALNTEVKARTQATVRARYGADTPFQSDVIIAKIKKTNQQRYGVDLPLQNPAIRAQAAESFKKKHGAQKMQFARAAWQLANPDTNPFSMPAIQQKIKNYWQEQWGVDHPAKVPQILAKSVATLMQNHGVANPAQIGIPVASLALLQNADQLCEKLTSMGVQSLADLLCVRPALIVSYHHRHGLTVLPRNARSLQEEDVYAFLVSLGVRVERNNRKLAAPLEIDFILPDFHIAIEYNGLYWHSELGGNKNKTYHQKKQQRCAQQQYQLLTIWEDEWLNQNAIVKRHIQHLVNQTTTVVGARKLCIHPVDLITCNAFLQHHHIQGAVLNSAITLAAWHGDQMVSVFTTQRKNIHTLDITRWCVDQRASYPGLLSKFVKYIHVNHNITAMTTVADLRWSAGKSYVQAGFILEASIPPDYQYTDYVSRDHKFNLRKTKISKKYNMDITGKTENQLCNELGFDRIWDCGKLKFVWRAA